MGTEITKCECEHADHDEIRCLRPAAVVVRTDYGVFALCDKCFKLLHMCSLAHNGVYKLLREL